MDADGYPEEAELDAIAKWDWHDFGGLFEYVRELWNYADCGYWTEEEMENKTIYNISTAGWSGNEDIIAAMFENRMLRAMCWVQSRRGGHYIFEVRL